MPPSNQRLQPAVKKFIRVRWKPARFIQTRDQSRNSSSRPRDTVSNSTPRALACIMNICFRSGCDHVLEPRDFPFLFFPFFPFPFFPHSFFKSMFQWRRVYARARKVAHGNIVFLYSLYGWHISYRDMYALIRSRVYRRWSQIIRVRAIQICK